MISKREKNQQGVMRNHLTFANMENGFFVKYDDG